jgi:hypothetical protein
MKTPKTFKELFTNTSIDPTTDESGDDKKAETTPKVRVIPSVSPEFRLVLNEGKGKPNTKSKEMEKQIERQQKFEKAVRPLMKYLAENHHPHTSVYVTARETALSEFQLCLSTDEYLVD